MSLRRKNYRGEMIPAACGMYVVAFALAGIAAAWVLGFIEGRIAAVYAGAITSMGALGLMDDLFGSREVGGFRGHFKVLLRERRLTTGAAKAIGGATVASAIATSISGPNVLQWLLAAGLVVLSANALNLLDLRPGRASAAFFGGMAAAFAAAGFSLSAPSAVAAIAFPAFVAYWWDRRALAMMGDVGSNALGVTIGLTIALDTGTWAQVVCLAFLLAINVYSERRSITECIERHPILNRIDRLTGVR